jgi:Na+-driven multidrug efflux pump
MYTCFWSIWIMISSEVMSIFASKAFGASNYPEMRLSLIRALTFSLLLTCLSFTVYCFSAKILVSINFDPEMSLLVQSVMLKLMPSLFVQTFLELLRNYMISQKISEPF